MKRMLFGWRDGSFRDSGIKWSARTTAEISVFMLSCKMPREFNRQPRGLNELAHWKGTEYRTFLMYIGVVALKDRLSSAVYYHFLLLFCAITICESNMFSHLLLLARKMLDEYLEKFTDIYGQQYMTSNIHNLSHLIDDVQKFGVLQSFSSYPFENQLGQMKKLIRNGRLPLTQLANRISEMTQIDTITSEECSKLILSQPNNGILVAVKFQAPKNNYYSKIDFGHYSLSKDNANKWFLTKSGEIVGLICVISKEKKISIYGHVLTNHYDFFEYPVKSRDLNIYASKYFTDDTEKKCFFDIDQIKCKLVRIVYNSESDVYIPLLHTLLK